ncbi:MAG: hypothetical protein JJT82_03565 [Legionellaceae bacterium]|nr:hypothetical protein [Legionellaceae bacterium]
MMENYANFFNRQERSYLKQYIDRHRNMRASYLARFDSANSLRNLIRSDIQRTGFFFIQGIIDAYNGLKKCLQGLYYLGFHELEQAKRHLKDAGLSASAGLFKLSFALIASVCSMAQVICQAIVTLAWGLLKLLTRSSGCSEEASPSSESSFLNQPLAFFKSLVRKASGSPVSRSALDRSSSELMQIMMELNATLARVRSERESINQQINEKLDELESWQASRSEYKPEVVEQLAKEIDRLHQHLQAFMRSFVLYPIIETNDQIMGDELSQYIKELEEHHATIKTAAKHLLDELDTCKKILGASGDYITDVRLQ